MQADAEVNCFLLMHPSTCCLPLAQNIHSSPYLSVHHCSPLMYHPYLLSSAIVIPHSALSVCMYAVCCVERALADKGRLPLYKMISIPIPISLRSCCLPCSLANKQDGSSALSDQELSDRLGLEQLVEQAVIEQCQVVSAACICM